jgi:hypothetical protein
MKKDILKGEPVPPERGGEMRPGPNVVIGTLNVIVQPLHELIDPVAKVCVQPFLEHYHHRYRKPWKHHAPKMLVIDLTLLALAAACLVGGIFAFYVLPAPTPWAGVNVAIIGPEQAASGAATKLTVTWANDSGTTMACAAMRLVLPPEVSLLGEAEGGREGATPCLPDDWPGAEGGKALIVPLGDLPTSTRGAVRLPVRLFGTAGQPLTAGAELIYWEEGETEPTIAAAGRTWPMTEATVKLDVTVPKDAERGRFTKVAVTYENTSNETMEGLSLEMQTPADFLVTGREPAASGAGRWEIAPLPPGGRGQVAVYGRFTAQAAFAPTFSAVASLATDTGTRRLAEERASANPLSAALDIAAEAVSPSGTAYLRPGQEVHLALRFRNDGTTAIRDAVVRLEIDEPKLVGGEDAAQAWQWDGNSAPGLKEIAPGDSGEITAAFRIREDALELAGGIRFTAAASYTPTDSDEEPILVDAPPLDFTFIAAARLSASAAYYTPDGDQLGLGPLPPRVGETTKYWVFLKAEAIGKAVSNAKIRGLLPSGVTWTGRVSSTAGQPPKLDSDTRYFSWTAGNLDPGRPVIASFEVALSPDEAAVGTVPKLTTGLYLTARDAASGVATDDVTDDLDTDLVGDVKAAGLGRVEPIIKLQPSQEQ